MTTNQSQHLLQPTQPGMAKFAATKCLGTRPLLLLSRVRLQVSAGGDDRASRNRIWHQPPIGVQRDLGTYYYTYSITSLIAGAALDRVGAKKAVPVGIFILAIGCLLFAIRRRERLRRKASSGRGSAFASLVRCIWASHGVLLSLASHGNRRNQCLACLADQRANS